MKHYEVSLNSDNTLCEPEKFNTLAEAIIAFDRKIEETKSLPKIDYERIKKAHGNITLDVVGEDGEILDTLNGWRL